MPIGPTSGFLDFTNATPRANVIIALSNVGVGTDVPLHALDIRGTANVADIIINNDLTLVGGLTTNTLTINSVSMSTTSNFQQVTNVGDAATTNTVQFTNPTTGFTVSSNAEVGGELSVSGNVEVGTANLFVDTTTGNVGVGTTEPTESLDIVGNLNLQKVSNTASIKLNSNVVTEYTRSKKLIKYPRVAMTSTSQDGYVISSSTADTNSSRTQYGAFDGIFDNSAGQGWQSLTRYSTSTGLPTGDADNATFTVAGTNYKGQWLKLQLPQKIRVESIVIAANRGGGVDDRRPHEGVFLGSNDNTNWELIKLFDIDTSGYVDFQSGADSRATISDITSTSHYEYIMFVITKIATTNQYGPVQINEIEYYGIPEYDPEAHGTDVIARSVPNVPNTDFLEVYYDGQDYTSMPSTITDKSGNGVTGTPSGVSFDSTWKAFSFDGSGDVITNTRSGYTGSGVYTASTWVNVRKEAAGITFPAVFQYGNGQSSTTDTAIGLAFRPDGAIRQFIYGNSDLDVYGHKQYNTWTHCTAIYMLSSSETKITLYINGEEVGFNSTSTGAAIGATPHLCIGAQANNSDSPLSSTYLHGSVANFRLFNRALSADEVWQLYAYQKDYFQVSPDVVTFKGGRLGIGTSEPRAVLDVKGDLYAHGSVVQVLQSVKTNSASTNSTSFVDTGLEITITPKSTSSKILVSYSANIGTNTSHAFLRLVRNGTSIAIGDAAGNRVQCTHYIRHFNSQSLESHCMEFLDSPSTTSSVTYKLQYSVASTSYTVTLNRAHSDGDNTYYGRGPSTITAKEIAQ
jgi:hypothetical protein